SVEHPLVPPVYQDTYELLEEGVERSKQLNATIEQLESAAMYEDDLAEHDQVDALESQISYQEYAQSDQSQVSAASDIDVDNATS
ncbi:hypothetical protein, partial [Escherichia coli]|uniref:hypothetical protein n=1 Tax=Escherichia coli TaxID=562 RepID=UPI00237BC665